MKRVLSIIMCAMLALSVLCMTGCGAKNLPEEGTTIVDVSFESGSVLGKGENSFKLVVSDMDGKKAEFEIHTDKTIVGDALEELGMISGEQGEYGLYVKTVNGITVDYDNDGKYWAFYVNGEYAMTGVDSTSITQDTEYMFIIQ